MTPGAGSRTCASSPPGLHPAILTQRGLAAAIHALAARLPIPVEIDVPGIRLPAPIEASVYFFCSEALTNVVKHAHARCAWIRLEIAADQCVFEVRDDGIGGAHARQEASGLIGLRDRIGALGGTLDIISRPAGGTVLRPASRSAVPRAGGRNFIAGEVAAQRVRVIVGEDQPFVREGIVRVLGERGFRGRRHRGRRPRPDPAGRRLPARTWSLPTSRCLRSNSDDGLRAALAIRAAQPGVGVLVLSQFLEDAYAFALVADGAQGVGYLLKEKVGDLRMFTDAVRRVAEGGSVLDPDVVARLVGRKRTAGPLDSLTPRERQVLALIAEGRSNAGIAQELVVTVAAIERHVTSIFDKLGLHASPEDAPPGARRAQVPARLNRSPGRSWRAPPSARTRRRSSPRGSRPRRAGRRQRSARSGLTGRLRKAPPPLRSHPPRQVDVQQYSVGHSLIVASSAWAASVAFPRTVKAALGEQLGRQAEEASVVIDKQDPNHHLAMVPRRPALDNRVTPRLSRAWPKLGSRPGIFTGATRNQERDHGVMPDTPRPPRGPSPRRLFAVAVAAAVACFILTLSYGYADHAPAPHGVRVAVAAPPGFTARLTTGLAHAAPGGFTIVAAPSAAAVRSSVLSQSAAGGLVTGAAGPVTIVTAAAAGPAQQQAVTAALTAAAAALHRPARLLDVAPLPAGDRAGLSVFVFELGLLIPSVLASIGLYFLGRRLRVWWRVTAAAAFALLAAGGSVLVLDVDLRRPDRRPLGADRGRVPAR